MIKCLFIDIMLHDSFVCTMRVPVTLGKTADYDIAWGGVILDLDKVQQYVENKRPSLKNKDYKICL